MVFKAIERMVVELPRTCESEEERHVDRATCVEDWMRPAGCGSQAGGIPGSRGYQPSQSSCTDGRWPGDEQASLNEELPTKFT